VQYPIVTQILAPCRADNHPRPTLPLASSYYSTVKVVWLVFDNCQLDMVPIMKLKGGTSSKLINESTRTYAVNSNIPSV
jgi:hypothetical protein